MNRNDYLTDIIIETIKLVAPMVKVKEDQDDYGIDAWQASIKARDLDEEAGNRWDDHRNEYLASCLANSSEHTGDHFRDNPELRERSVNIYLGKHDRAKAIFSREYEDDEGETINSHILVDHVHDNNHLEGVQRMATAYFSFMNTDVED